MARVFALVMLWVGTAAWASPKGDWFASLYTGEGVELRQDERVFALFALLNAAGFDQAPVSRKDPVPRSLLHPVRQQVRARVLGGDAEVRRAAEVFLDAHPVALKKYLTYALGSEQPPFAAGPKGKELQDLKGLEQLLGKAWSAWKLEELMAVVQADSRKAQKAYLNGTDMALQRAKALLKVPESQEVIIVVNLLDAQDQVHAVVGENGELVIIVGPSEKPNIEGVIREFARAKIEPIVARAASKWPAGAAVLKEAQQAGAQEQTVAEYVGGTIGLALALRSLEANETAYEAAAAHGAFGIRDIAKLFDEGKSLESVVSEALQKIETRRPAKK